MKKYIGIAGTNYDKSLNKKLMKFIQTHFKDQAEIEIIDISNLPVFYKVPGGNLPIEVQVLDEKIAQADGVIFATPEYDHSVPAVLMNAMEWFSYVNQPFHDKPVLITGVSYGSLGTSRAQDHLRQILNAPELSAALMPSQEFLVGRGFQAFNEDGALTNEDMVKDLEAQMSEFNDFVAQNK